MTGELIGIVDEIYQFGTPSATGLLSLLFPACFGTVDRFVVKSLQRIEEFKDDITNQEINPENIGLDDAVRAISIMQSKALQLNELFNIDYWTPRRTDMILYSTRETGSRIGPRKPSRNTKEIDVQTRPAAWKVVDKVAKCLAGQNGDNLITARAFSEEMRSRGYKGVQASDYVRGAKNKDPRSGVHPVFEKVERGKYR